MCFIAALTVLFKHYMATKCDLDAKKFDLLTITAADYTVSLNITKEMNDEFNKSQQELLEKYTVGFAWIDFLTKRVESILQRYIESKGDLQRNKNISVAQITLAFNNNQIIEMLERRGSAIASTQFDKQRKIDEEINKFIKVK